MNFAVIELRFSYLIKIKDVLVDIHNKKKLNFTIQFNNTNFIDLPIFLIKCVCYFAKQNVDMIVI